MTVFFDTSALVKRYADESGSDLVRDLNSTVVISELAKVEVPAAIWRKHRLGGFSAKDARDLCRQFSIDFAFWVSPQDTQVIKASTDILHTAADLVARHPLRAYDAMQLASALEVLHVVGECTFGCFDRQLSTAASIEGLPLLW